MPIIKDKYTGKGSQTRSKFVTRKINKAEENPVPSAISTEQQQELSTQAYRNDARNVNQVSITSPLSISSNINPTTTTLNKVDYSILKANKEKLLFILKKGESLIDLIIHNYNSGFSSSIITVYWSSGDQDDISFTVGGGVITSTTGAIVTPLFGSEFPYLGTVSLKDLLIVQFNNINKDIYFYAVSNLEGPSVTFIKTSG